MEKKIRQTRVEWGSIVKSIKSTTLYKYCCKNNCNKIKTIIYDQLISKNIIYQMNYFPFLLLQCYHNLYEKIESNVVLEIIDENLISYDTNYLDEIKCCLLSACKNNNQQIVQMIIYHGIDINECTIFIDNPLQYLCESDNWNLIKLLIDNGVHVTTQLSTFFYKHIDDDNINKYFKFCYDNETYCKLIFYTQKLELIVQLFIQNKIYMNDLEGQYLGNLLTCLGHDKSCVYLEYFLNIELMSQTNMLVFMYYMIIYKNDLAISIVSKYESNVFDDMVDWAFDRYQQNLMISLFKYKWNFTPELKKKFVAIIMKS